MAHLLLGRARVGLPAKHKCVWGYRWLLGAGGVGLSPSRLRHLNEGASSGPPLPPAPWPAEPATGLGVCHKASSAPSSIPEATHTVNSRRWRLRTDPHEPHLCTPRSRPIVVVGSAMSSAGRPFSAAGLAPTAILQQAAAQFEQEAELQMPKQAFVPSGRFEGPKPGYYFSRGDHGIGCAPAWRTPAPPAHQPPPRPLCRARGRRPPEGPPPTAAGCPLRAATTWIDRCSAAPAPTRPGHRARSRRRRARRPRRQQSCCRKRKRRPERRRWARRRSTRAACDAPCWRWSARHAQHSAV